MGEYTFQEFSRCINKVERQGRYYRRDGGLWLEGGGDGLEERLLEDPDGEDAQDEERKRPGGERAHADR